MTSFAQFSTIHTMIDIVVGVDSGGSKTVAIAGDVKGKILGRGTAGAANPLSVGVERALENIVTAIKNATSDIKDSSIVSLYVGTAGGKPKALKDMHKAVSLSPSLKITGNITVDHDLRTALYSGLPDGKGIVLIVGTGSAAFGIDKEGRDVIVSGWNHWLGETGGYEMGMKAIIAATRSFDGRGGKTILEKIIAERFALKDFMDLSSIIKAPFIDSPKIASLAPFVAKAAQKGDRAAKKIISEMIEEMSCSIKAAAKRVGMKDNLQVVLVGGIFNMKLPIIEKLKKKMGEWCKNFEFIFPKEEPAVTAFKLALKNLQKAN